MGLQASFQPEGCLFPGLHSSSGAEGVPCRPPESRFLCTEQDGHRERAKDVGFRL